jgi:hypothetical protein
MMFSRALNVVDAHAEGESGKVVVGGVGPVPGEEPLIGSRFDAHIESTTTVGPYDSVVPSISAPGSPPSTSWSSIRQTVPERLRGGPVLGAGGLNPGRRHCGAKHLTIFNRARFSGPRGA